MIIILRILRQRPSWLAIINMGLRDIGKHRQYSSSVYMYRPGATRFVVQFCGAVCGAVVPLA